MNAVSISNPSVRKSESVGRSRHWLAWTALACAVAAVVIPGVLYWQEAPLRAAHRDADAGDVPLAYSRVCYFLDRHPDHGDALALKARLLVQLGQATEALEIFDRVGAATAEDLHAWSRAYMNLGRFSHAAPRLAQVLELDPVNVDALYELSAVKIRLGLLEEAIPVAQRLAEVKGQEGRGHVLLAIIYNDVGNHAKAAVEFAKALQFNPDASNLQLPPGEILSQYAGVLSILGQTEKAIDYFERSVAAQPDPTVYVLLGNGQSTLGRSDEARRSWKTALELDPNHRPAREALANAALQDAEPAAALEWLKPLENRQDLTSGTAYLMQRTYVQNKDQAAADKWKEKAEKLRAQEKLNSQIEEYQMKVPNSFWGNVLRAYKFARQGNWEQAEDMLEGITGEPAQDPFVRDLKKAVEARGELPAVERLPIPKF